MYGTDVRWLELAVSLGKRSLEQQLEGALGVIELTGEEKIYAIDGQHRIVGMKKAPEQKPSLMTDGAASVVLLHHSIKGTKESASLTLDNSMRGSGELGAFVASKRKYKRTSTPTENSVLSWWFGMVAAHKTQHRAHVRGYAGGHKMLKGSASKPSAAGFDTYASNFWILEHLEAF